MSYENNVRHFVVSGEPKGKGRPRATIRGKHASVYTPAETAMYENHVAQCYLSKYADCPMFEGALRVVVHAYFKYPRAAYWPVNKKHNGELRAEWKGRGHITKPDLDNVVKAILDGLNKANVWRDDSQVAILVAYKMYSENPRVEVFVKEGDDAE